MRAALVFCVLLFGCNRQTELGTVAPPKGWTVSTTTSHASVIDDLRLDYKERQSMTITTATSPSGQQELRVIKLRSQDPTFSLLARIAGYRGPGARRIDTVGDLSIDELDTDDGYHIALQIVPPASDNPDQVTRTPTLLASCTGSIAERDPCRKAIAKAVDAAKDDADGSWLYWYIGGLAFAALVIGRRLQIGRRLLPPKGPSGLPNARVRK